MTNIKGYITNLGKYNEGELVGTWIDFPISQEDLEEVLEEIEIDGKEYEEYFFTDWEYNEYPDFEFGEHVSIKKVNEIAQTLEDYNAYQIDTLNAIQEVWGSSTLKERDFDIDEYALQEDINSDYDLGYYWAVESGCYDLHKMGNLSNYLDYEAFGRDIRFECDGGFSKYGFVERVR